MNSVVFTVIVVVIAAILIGAFFESDSTIVKGVIILALVVAAMTRPNREEHLEAIQEELVDAAQSQFGAFGGLAAAFASVGLPFVLDIDNYLFFNVGKMKDDNGDTTILSVGIFGKVIAFDLDE